MPTKKDTFRRGNMLNENELKMNKWYFYVLLRCTAKAASGAMHEG